MSTERKMRGKLCMVCDTQATRFLEGYAYCAFHDRSTRPLIPSMGKDSRVYRVASSADETMPGAYANDVAAASPE